MRPLAPVKARPGLARFMMVATIALLLVSLLTTYYYGYSFERSSQDVPRTLVQIVVDGWQTIWRSDPVDVDPYVVWDTGVLVLVLAQLGTLVLAVWGRFKPAVGAAIGLLAIIGSLPMTAFALSAPGSWILGKPPGPAAYAMPVADILYLLLMVSRGLVAGWRTPPS